LILSLSLLFCVSIFLTKSSFLQGRNLGWCDVSVLDSVFVGWVLFYLLCFFLWVNCSVFLGFLLLPSGAAGCSISGFFASFLLSPAPLISAPFIETQPLASNLQDCYLPRQDRGRETWSTIRFVADYQLPCWIGSSPVEAGWRRCTAVSNGAVSAENRNFQFDPCLWKFDNLIPTIF